MAHTHALGWDREKCLAAGMDDHLSKPVLPNDLMRVVDQGLKNSRPLPKPASAGASAAKPSTASDLRPIDPAAIARLGDTRDDEFVLRMIAVFLPDLDERLKTIRDAYAAVDASGVRQPAHALKGSWSHFGAKGLIGICADLRAREWRRPASQSGRRAHMPAERGGACPPGARGVPAARTLRAHDQPRRAYGKDHN